MRCLRGLLQYQLELKSFLEKQRSSPLRTISTSPRLGMASTAFLDTLVVEGRKYRHVREGLASVLAPYAEESRHPGKQARNNDEGSQAVFYNPIQQFNRDLSVLAITVYGEGAVLEKEVRHSQKKPKKKARSQAQIGDKPVDRPEEVNHRKRKADQLPDGTGDQDGEDANKKLKPNDESEDDDGELLVEALAGDPTAKQNGQTDAAPAEAGKPEAQPSTITTTKKKQAPFAILDALSATGLRALRYAKEIPFATKIVANDLSAASVQNIELNIQHNEVKDKVHANLDDARAFMYSKVGNERYRQGDGYVHRFDVIDLDPYGTAAPFLDASLQAIQDGGMLCVTCTDAGVFASTGYAEKTYALYGGMPLKGPHSHEGGLRLIINAVAISAARYGLAIEPLLSLYIDYYARVFIRVHRKPHEVKLLAGTTMIVYSCGHGCGAWTTQPLLRNQPQMSKKGEAFYKFSFAQAPTTGPNCEHCGMRMHLGGPMWAGPLHNPYFVQRMLDRVPSLDKQVYGTTERLEGMLTLALEEDLTLVQTGLNPQEQQAEKDATETSPAADPRTIPRLPPNLIDVAPFFVMPTQIAKAIHCTTPSEDMMRGAILGLGYRVSRSHCKPGSIKTTAPWSVLWEVIREFMRTKAPIKEGAVKPGSAGWNILAKVRGTERAIVSEVKDGARDQLRRCETKADLKTVLQGMLWRLDNDRPAAAVEPEQAKEVPDRANGHGGDQPAEEDDPRNQQPEGQGPSVAESSRLNIVFDEKLGREKRRNKLVRYQVNPRENWGPMNRAGRAG